ncbi:MAG: Crp/Fnr family transcriptional regulator [Thermoleophilia bacterium]|nr:Crp/Fnr family transcriptional regulator [Thermoleophilia bacterium]MDH3724555.1 Crp/Fnr family transcriptional regulator [Thermoleophilia bacterium]
MSLPQMELFSGLPERDLALLDSRLAVIRWPCGAEAPEPLKRADHLYLVREGRLGMFERTAPGHEIMITILEAGSAYSTLGAAPPAAVEALEDAAVSPLPRRALEGLITRYPRLGVNLADLMSDRVAMLRETVALVSEMRVEDRLRARLHQLAERFGVTTKDGIQLRLDLTHAQWATLVGASREAVTTAFSKLRSSGSVIVDGRDITLPWDVVREREERLTSTAS